MFVNPSCELKLLFGMHLISTGAGLTHITNRPYRINKSPLILVHSPKEIGDFLMLVPVDHTEVR
jgi:hypothetical protein